MTVTGGILVHPGMQRQVRDLVVRADLGPRPPAPVDRLGPVERPDGSLVDLYWKLCADIVVTDFRRVILVTRRFDPGRGKWATPGGGFDQADLDAPPASSSRWSPRTRALWATAIREAEEETGVDRAIIEAARVQPLRRLRTDFAFGIRAARTDDPDLGIQAGDLLAFGTQCFAAVTSEDLSRVRLKPGPNEKRAAAIRISQLKPDRFGIRLQVGLIQEALRYALA
jgi:8-oxo-dGTP pyrophosphatase MutT (NUDIX family)